MSKSPDLSSADSAARSAPTSADSLIVFMVSHSSAGGAQEIWANLADGFRARGFRVKLVALYPHQDERKTVPATPWTYIAPRRPASPPALFGMLRALVRFFRTERPTAVFTAMPAANVLAPIAAKLSGSGARVVISHHSPTGTHNWVLDLVDGVTGSFGDVAAVVSVSDTVGRSLEGKPNRYRAKRRTIKNALPPGIEQQLMELAAQRSRTRKLGRLVIATGRLATQKNYPLLIRAAVHMPDVAINVIGGGPEEETLKSLAGELGVADRVHFLGSRPREEAMLLLSDGDVFAQPSLFEGHSLALIEAAKLGLPLVVSDIPVQIEGITTRDGSTCGIAVDPQDDRALARAIVGLLDDPARHEAYTAKARGLGAEASFESMLDAYQDLARRP